MVIVWRHLTHNLPQTNGLVMFIKDQEVEMTVDKKKIKFEIVTVIATLLAPKVNILTEKMKAN